MLSNGLALPHLLLIALVVLVLFGKGKVAGLMGEVGKGMTAFKRGIHEGEADIAQVSPPAQTVTPATPATAAQTATEENKA